MVARLPVWFFLSVALLLIGAALLPLLRFALGLAAQPQLAFFTTVSLLMGGLMSGLTAMILMVRRQPRINWADAPVTSDSEQRNTLLAMHASGLLLFSGIPLLNFLVAYWLWIKHRRADPHLDETGRKVLDFQITIYLYLLLSLFLVIAVIGLLTTALLLAFHLLVTLLAIGQTLRQRDFNYPASIPVTHGRPPASE